MSSKSKRVFPNSTVNAFHIDGDVSIVEATYEHAEYLQNHLRSPDVRECMIHGATPWRALRYPIMKKDAVTYTALHKGVPACMFGVVPIYDDLDLKTGSIWLLGTDEIDKYPRKFLRASKPMLEYFMDRWDVVENVVPMDHKNTIEWLAWLGFLFSDEETLVNGFSCIRFVRCARHVEVSFD